MLHLKFSGYYNLNGNHEAVPRSTEAETSLFVFRHHRLPEALPFPFMTRDLLLQFQGAGQEPTRETLEPLASAVMSFSNENSKRFMLRYSQIYCKLQQIERGMREST